MNSESVIRSMSWGPGWVKGLFKLGLKMKQARKINGTGCMQ